MFRTLALAGAIATGVAIVPSVPAHAEPLCQSVVVIVDGQNYPFANCLPYPDDITCNTTTLGPPSPKLVVTVCVPSVVSFP